MTWRDKAMASLLARLSAMGDKSVARLDGQLPHWRIVRAELGSLPLGHEDWRT